MFLQKNSVKESLTSLLSCNRLFESLESTEITPYIDRAVFKQYPKGHLLFVQDEPAEWFYVIQNGWVKLFRETLDGDEAIADILTEGQLFGETAIFSNGAYPYSAEVVEDAGIHMIPISVLNNHITSSNKLALNMLYTMSLFRQQQSRELEHLSIQSAPQRIGCFLLKLYKPSTATPIRIHLPYDKMLIAARLGMQPETFSRALLKLQQTTGIRIQGATVEIDDIRVLTDYSCNACSSTYPCEDN